MASSPPALPHFLPVEKTCSNSWSCFFPLCIDTHSLLYLLEVRTRLQSLETVCWLSGSVYVNKTVLLTAQGILFIMIYIYLWVVVSRVNKICKHSWQRPDFGWLSKDKLVFLSYCSRLCVYINTDPWCTFHYSNPHRRWFITLIIQIVYFWFPWYFS